MNAIGSAVARDIGARLDAGEGQMQRVFRALRAAHIRTVREQSVPHAPRVKVADRDPSVVRINSNPIWEQAAVHHFAQDAVARILVDRSGTVAHVGPWTGGPRTRAVMRRDLPQRRSGLPATLQSSRSMGCNATAPARRRSPGSWWPRW